MMQRLTETVAHNGILVEPDYFRFTQVFAYSLAQPFVSLVSCQQTAATGYLSQVKLRDVYPLAHQDSHLFLDLPRGLLVTVLNDYTECSK